MHVTKEDVEKAEAEFLAADALVDAYNAAYAVDTDAAEAADSIAEAYNAAWDKYTKLHKEYENGKG